MLFGIVGLRNRHLGADTTSPTLKLPEGCHKVIAGVSFDSHNISTAPIRDASSKSPWRGVATEAEQSDATTKISAKTLLIITPE